MMADLTTGALTAIVEERLNTYQERRPPVPLSDGSFVWWSARDGWAPLYRYSSDGSLIARLTSGAWHVGSVVRTDPQTDQIFFVAHGREAGIDPTKLAAAQQLQRKASFYVDYVEAENSSGFHAPQEAARILGESINYSRQGQLALR